MKDYSSRHHYIPKFLINGFTNNEGYVYIYDKEKDRILDNGRSPKSIFFELDRNTIENSRSEKSSVIEDNFYMSLDNSSSKLIQRLQKEKITSELLNIENQAELQFFLINLFWRLPITDYAVIDLIIRAKIDSDGINPITLRNDRNFTKMQRSGLFIHTVNKLKESIPEVNKYFAKITEFGIDTFILGDYPIVYESTPKEFTDLGYLDFLFALSSRRIYSSTKSAFGEFTKYDIIYFNVLIIMQSKKYICSGNLELLETSVKCYKELVRLGLHYNLEKNLFSRENRSPE
ncbi:DUF4238 domain-containing protein [Pontibacter sp. HSC-14F20]|uniref:DUF4238 domain-containing protein n=1 Tax=Pontibacter sp. HSC-14F20 TaxID=2864136 RepID=UPI001C7343B6|nr:DUF4238 domain-containing protein [Pontibacter sp. HSC-14F20]MBX0335548.1 DUF4238 domain-containing protein [Pontibacter sp. HSC-14F20]